MRQCLPETHGQEGIFQKGDKVNQSDYLVEAAEALDAPGEIWLFRDRILYDPATREWYFSGSPVKGLKLSEKPGIGS